MNPLEGHPWPVFKTYTLTPPTSGGVVGLGLAKPAPLFDCNQEMQMHLQMHILAMPKIERRKPNPNPQNQPQPELESEVPVQEAEAPPVSWRRRRPPPTSARPPPEMRTGRRLTLRMTLPTLPHISGRS